ncbi:MAG TPA: hypothetical protein VH413_13200 [Verrucomicrobiae bacterium]|jgi:hypothetical protein|nr:hypothetical protein [Verrucomicrobiae bacterium]
MKWKNPTVAGFCCEAEFAVQVSQWAGSKALNLLKVLSSHAGLELEAK